MELFDKNGCLTDEGLQALQAGGLDELGRLETAEHLSYCDKCMDRYTALLTADALETPPHSAHKAVMAAIWVRLMQNTWGRAAVAGVAAVLAFTMWRSGTIDQLLNFRQELHTWTPETSQSQTEEALQLGKPVEDGRPSAGRLATTSSSSAMSPTGISHSTAKRCPTRRRSTPTLSPAFPTPRA